MAASATGTTTATAYELEMQGVNYTNFIDGIRSPASKKGYRNSIARYCRYLKLTNALRTGGLFVTIGNLAGHAEAALASN